MEIAKGINFNNNLIENHPIELSYSGFLYNENTELISVVYGYGDSWEHTIEQKMEKCENSFKTTISVLPGYKALNFCFKDLNGVWDNNYEKNFTSEIHTEEEFSNTTSTTSETSVKKEKKTLNYRKSTPTAKIYKKVISQNDINNTFDTLFDNTNTITDTNKLTYDERNIISELFTELFKLDVSEFQKTEFIAEYEEKKPVEITTTECITTIEEGLTDELADLSTLEDSKSTLLDDILESTTAKIEINNPTTEEPTIHVDVNTIVNDILTPVKNGEYFTESDDTLESYFELKEKSQNIEEYQCENSSDKVDSIVSDLVTDLYEKSKEAVHQIETEEISEQEDTIIIDNEGSLLDEIIANNENAQTVNTNTVEISKAYRLEHDLPEETALVVSARALTPFYTFKKRIKLAIYKFFTAIPSIIKSSFEENSNK